MLSALISLLLFGFSLNPANYIQEVFTNQYEIQDQNNNQQPEPIDNQTQISDDNNQSPSSPPDSQQDNDQNSQNEDPQENDSKTEKVEAYNHASGKVIKGVSKIATERSPVLENCETNPFLCQSIPTPTPSLPPTPTPTPIPEPPIIPNPIPSPIHPIPTPTLIPHPPCPTNPRLLSDNQSSPDRTIICLD